jgi:hypothetical protein
MSKEDLYNMDLHEETELWRGCCVMRVPGGWLYRFENEQAGGHWTTSTAFVPNDDPKIEITQL